TIGSKTPKPIVSHSRSENSLVSLKGSDSLTTPKKQTRFVPAPETAVTGDGEDYFLSLFGESKKLLAHSFHSKRTWRHFSMILEELGQSRYSALGDIKIAEVNVKDLFVKLINSSLDKELEIGGHILQQNVDAQRVSLYRFLPDIRMQANCTATAIAWYTPTHWKQAWEKPDTDTEFDRCSVVSPVSQRHRFHWAPAVTPTKEKQDQSKEDTSRYQMEPGGVFLQREKDIPSTLFPNHSPWCHSPNVPAHPYCPLIGPYYPCEAGSSLGRQPRPWSPRPDPGGQAWV
ncbi:lamin tail domain-containing protein 1-like, partial [Manis javanica]|uniref:lamin tail domain-containing protein 1-like n=1 Tax=Manis javanica TaxID=9974 RepID=UPI003C6D3582